MVICSVCKRPMYEEGAYLNTRTKNVSGKFYTKKSRHICLDCLVAIDSFIETYAKHKSRKVVHVHRAPLMDEIMSVALETKAQQMREQRIDEARRSIHESIAEARAKYNELNDVRYNAGQEQTRLSEEIRALNERLRDFHG